MDRSQWQSLLTSWAAEAVQRAGMRPNEEPFSGLGFPGATETALRDAEARLGCNLPSSYREFLACTNGLRQPEGVFTAHGGDFWPVEQLDWFRIRNADWIAAYTVDPYDVPDSLYFVYGPGQDSVNFRADYLWSTLEISHDGDSSVYLLNPRVVGADGEWEAWFFANWAPGARRYRSFAEMMLDQHDAFRDRAGQNGF